MHGTIWNAWRCAAAVVAAAALAPPAAAVVITTRDDSANREAPPNDPGWLNVGRIAGASGVYLGNRWVITANHVSNAPLRLSDGREFAVSVGSDVRLTNAGLGPGSPDLRMFRLARDPGLPALPLAEAVPGIGTQIVMIGAGADRSNELIAWQRLPVWREVPFRSANALGYSVLSTSQMRWGVNQVGSAAALGADQTLVFSTRFDFRTTAFEAQAVVGDSGGGVFHLDDGAWKLLGIMTSTRMLPGQPDETVVFGNETLIADLSAYSGQILGFVDRDEPLWQNQVNHFDVSGSGLVDTRDLLLLANELLSVGSHELAGAPGPSDPFLDVNGDYLVSAGDAHQLVNAMLGGTANPRSAPPPGVTFVPEPASALLAALGLLSVVLAGRRLRRRRKESLAHRRH